MPEELGEKTEEPTDKKLSDARNRGQVAKSADLAAFWVMLGALVMCIVFAGVVFRETTLVTRFILSPEVMGTDVVGERLLLDMQTIGERMAWSLAVFMVVMAFIGAVAQASQVGLKLSTQAIAFRPEKMDPIKGAGRIFGKKGAVKAGMEILKLSVLGTLAWFLIHRRWEELMAIGLLPLMDALALAVRMMIELAAWILLAMLVLGILDFMYQKWQHKDDLKMTKQEVKDERKSVEGDMETKRRRMQMARDIAMQQLGADVPRADVVVTNPTHFAVALKYDQGDMHAPRVIAKGADYLALRIRQIATAAGVPIVERPPLARALYANVPVGSEIDAEHYEAVAEVLAYGYRLDRKHGVERAGVTQGAGAGS